VVISSPNQKLNLGSQLAAATTGSITWSSNKKAVATVDETGQVTVRNAGTVKITAKSGNKKGKNTVFTIKIKQAVTNISLSTKSGDTSVQAGKSLTLKASLNESGVKPSNKKLVWTIDSADPNIKINKSTGKITVKKGAAAGTYTVTATAADGYGAKATKTITVKAATK
jgi:uncharacterized protein YjdB